jgi:pimeloyl-ACP methyl ester carboxylesterase
MKIIAGFLLVCVFGFIVPAQSSPAPRSIDLKAADGTPLKATYFAASRPGPGVLLLHQSNRDRKSWDSVKAQLANAGINTLTLDMRGFGESGGTKRGRAPEDVDSALEFLRSQPGVKRNIIGLGGAGWLGVLHSVEAARRHPEEVKSLVLMSGETERDGLNFLHQAEQLPELFVFSDDDEYPPTQDAMKLLYVTASSPSKTLVHYSSAEDAPWLWYETSDASRVPAHGGHGTDMFTVHPDLPGIIVHWFVTTLIKTPGHAPADGLAAAPILNQLQNPGGAAQVTQQLIEARRKDPLAQLWPEVAVDIIGEDYQRAGDFKNAIETFKLNLVAYPDSADAHFNLADAYLADGQKELARQYAEKALALLDAHRGPLSSWSDTEQRRGEIRKEIQRVLKESQAPARSGS